MACAKCGGVLDCFCPGAPASGGGVGLLEAPAPEAPPTGPLPIGVLPRVRKRYSTCDVLVYPDRLVLSHVPGVSYERVGRWLGVLGGVLGSLIGAIVGRHLDAAGNTERTTPLRSMPAEVALRASPKNLAVPVRGLAAIDVRSEMNGGRILLRDGGRGAMKLRWHKTHTKDIDVPVALGGTYGGLVRATQQSALASIAVVVAIALVSVVVLVGALLTLVGTTVESDPAFDAADRACFAFYDGWVALGDREIYYVELLPAVGEAEPHMQRAASLDPAWAEGADALAWLEVNLPRTETDTSPLLSAAVEQRLAVLDEVCGVG